MVKLPDIFGRHLRAQRGVHARQASSSEEDRAAEAQFEMASALVFGLQRKNAGVRFVEHCARVAELVDEIAAMLSLDPADREDLRAAAQLHEVGMISVPAELIESRAALDEIALARVRAQARVGAEILLATQTPRVCRLVEHQYTDFDEIRLRYSADSREILLAGILRAADVLDTMRHPRPYQADLDPGLSIRVLEAGEGTQFHPRAVRSLLQLRSVTN